MNDKSLKTNPDSMIAESGFVISLRAYSVGSLINLTINPKQSFLNIIKSFWFF